VGFLPLAFGGIQRPPVDSTGTSARQWMPPSANADHCRSAGCYLRAYYWMSGSQNCAEMPRQFQKVQVERTKLLSHLALAIYNTSVTAQKDSVKLDLMVFIYE
jgi:hypothetical protein